MTSTARWATRMGFVAFAVGCGSSIPPPHDEWAAAQADLGRAQASGAATDPQARLHLDLAQEDIQKAKAAMGEDNARAATLSQMARAEAQLAASLAKTAAREDSARKAESELQSQQQGGGK